MNLLKLISSDPYPQYAVPELTQRWKHVCADNPRIVQAVQLIERAGGRVYMVGGWVRDAILGHTSYDLDAEIHGLSANDICSLFSHIGTVSEQGASFGVFRVHGLDVDWSLPRRDSAGRKPTVTVDPTLDIRTALERRDVTMNALAYDVHEDVVHDPWGGVEDMRSQRLRTPNPERFVEDPLRFYRVMQYVARFSMYPDSELTALCKTMSLTGIASERICAELDKLFLLSSTPSHSIRWLQDIDRLRECMPEVYALRGIPQNPQYHPEGDVFEHTLCAVDYAAQQGYESDQQRLQTLWAVLCHDMGKVNTTRMHEGRLISWRHEETGVPITKAFMQRFMQDRHRIARTCTLVRFHMQPCQFVKNKAGLGAYRRLAGDLARAQLNMYDLSLVVRADSMGRAQASSLACVEEFLKRTAQAGVTRIPLTPLLHGEDLIPPFTPGPELGKALAHAYAIQCAHPENRPPLTKEQLVRIICTEFKKR